MRVLFFGRVREELDCDSLELPLEGPVVDLESLQAHLCETRGGKWQEILGQDNIICAVNQTVTDTNVALSDSDEVAFFPPVTGG